MNPSLVSKKTSLHMILSSLLNLALIPLTMALLFSYTKAPRHPKIGLYFPAGAMLVILILYLEGTRLLLWRLPLHKVDLKEMSEYIRTVFLMLK